MSNQNGGVVYICISCVTILQRFIKIGQAFLEELRSQSY